MNFANPSYLWALTGLAIPLAIHLLSRKEGKVIRVGSIRHVEESNTSQFKSIRLNEILLLLLRMVLITLLALFMSGARCSGPGDPGKLVYAEQGINVDSLTSKGFELRRIPAGANYWALVEELTKLPNEIVVISYSKVDNFKGKRVVLNDNIKWITAESGSIKADAFAWSAGDSVFTRTAISNAAATSYTTRVGLPDSIAVIDPVAVNVTTDDRIVKAAINVLKKQYKLPINFSAGQTISITPGIGPLVERISPTRININRPLDQDVALDENLVIALFKVLYPELQKPAINVDARVLPDEFMWSPAVAASAPQSVTTSGIEKYLILLFILSLAAERFVAIRRNQ